jgi:hypothetical protein
VNEEQRETNQTPVSDPVPQPVSPETALKEREIAIKAREVNLTARFQALSFVSAVLGACLAFFGTAWGNWHQATANRDLEKTKAQENKDLGEQKLKNDLAIERQKLEGNLILTFLADKDDATRIENLLFLNRAGYIHLPEDLVKKIETGEQFVPHVDPGASFGPPEGTALPGTPQALLNQLKNRSEEPQASDFDTSVDFARMLAVIDEKALDQTKAATVKGYVVRVKLAGLNTANMNESAASKRDIHIYVAPKMESGPDEQVICVVTPRFRAKHDHDWSLSALSQALTGKQCKITGWLYFDPNLSRFSANNPHHTNTVFRGTSWELHPVTAIEPIN